MQTSESRKLIEKWEAIISKSDPNAKAGPYRDEDFLSPFEPLDTSPAGSLPAHEDGPGVGEGRG